MSARSLLTPGLEIDSRIGVRVDDYANSSANGKEPAYLYNPDKASFGLDPWRTIDKVELPRSPASESHTLLGKNFCKDVGPRYVIYVQPEVAELITRERDGGQS